MKRRKTNRLSTGRTDDKLFTGSHLERCPSGLRSTIGNRVSREIGIVGSNPTLSVPPLIWLIVDAVRIFSVELKEIQSAYPYTFIEQGAGSVEHRSLRKENYVL